MQSEAIAIDHSKERENVKEAARTSAKLDAAGEEFTWPLKCPGTHILTARAPARVQLSSR